MKKSVLTASLIFCVLHFSVFAQMKTSFTKENRPDNSMPTGMVDGASSKIKNKKDVKMPSKTRGIERYQKLNVYGEPVSDDFLFYRNLLNERQQVVYDQIYKGLMKCEKIIPLQAKTNSDELHDAICAVRYDNPEGFWWSGAYSWWSNSDDIATKVELEFWLEDSQLQQAYNNFWAMTVPIIYYASSLPDDMSKIKYVHDYICLSTEYDYDSLNAGNVGGKLQTAYSCAVDYKTVCAGYSSCFQYYMQNLGIPCVSVWGSGHQWNFLKIDGDYYQMDVIWNDTEMIPTHYNLKSEDMQKIESHTPTQLAKALIEKYPGTSEKMSYVTYHGMLLEGSPYTYQELGLYDYELANNNSKYVYQEEPRKIPLINTLSDFKTTLCKLLENKSDEYIVLCSTQRKNLYQNILDEMSETKNISDIIYTYNPEATGYSYSYSQTTLQNFYIIKFKFDVH